MGNWLQRLEDTSEHTPGPWLLEGPCAAWGWKYRLAVYGTDDEGRTICTINPTPGAQITEEVGYDTCSDPEQEATARLMSEAPKLLELLAYCMTHMPHLDTSRDDVMEQHRTFNREASALLARHCRIGVGPPDELTAAARSEPPPPPPPPSQWDEID